MPDDVEVDRLPKIASALRNAGRRFGAPVAVTDVVGLDTAAARVAAASLG